MLNVKVIDWFTNICKADKNVILVPLIWNNRSRSPRMTRALFVSTNSTYIINS